MSYWIVLYGPGLDGKLVDFAISNPFPTIGAAAAEARRIGAAGPGQFTPFHEGKAASSNRIRDKQNVFVSEVVFDAGRWS
jgi:hypothetical protein